MNKTLLALALLLLQAVLFAGTGQAKDYTLITLGKEASKLTPLYTARGNLPPKPQEADLLRRAADVMVGARQCAAAIPLYRQAALFSGQPDAELWLAVARASSCAKDWKRASQSGWLAYAAINTAANSDALRAEALLLTAMALEKRTTSYHNWTPVAIDFYERLNKLKSSPENAERLARLRIKQNEDRKLLIQSYTADSSSGHPRLCIGVNDDLLNPEQAHYGDYVRVSPALNADFYVEYHKLCIGGASYGTTYEVTLRKGLKGRNRELMDTAAFNIATGHSPSQLWFNQNDYILADASGAVGLHTVNVNKVKLRLYRIHERNILGEFVSNAFRRKLNEYELETIKNREGELVWEGTTGITANEDEKKVSDLALPKQAIAAPGLYILIAEDGNTTPKRWQGAASQWLVKTNIGLTTYQGNDGLTVMARSLDTALPLAGVDITLTARNNTPLGTLTTDEKGLVRFAPGLLRGKGGQAAVQLVSMDSRQGFTFLQLQQAPFDFSDRGWADALPQARWMPLSTPSGGSIALGKPLTWWPWYEMS